MTHLRQLKHIQHTNNIKYKLIPKHIQHTNDIKYKLIRQSLSS